MKKTVRIMPLPKVTGFWNHEWSDYPDVLRVPMSDGQVVTYERKIEQPHPKCMKTVELIRMMNDCTYGGYKAKHGKK